MLNHNKTERNYYLDLLRTLFAISVMFLHFNNTYLFFHLSSVATCVDLFFILSAFVLTKSLSINLRYTQFVINRIARIFPLYLFLLLIVTILQIKWIHINFVNFVHQILLLQIFTSQKVGLIGQSWSLCIEFWLNISFLYLVNLMYFRYQKSQKYIIAILFIIIALCFNALHRHGTMDIWSYNHYATIRGINGFSIGFLLFIISQFKIKNTLAPNNLQIFILQSCLFCILFGVMFLYKQNVFLNGCVVVASFSLIIILSECNKNKFSIFTKYKILKNIGQISYSIYLIHLIVLSLYQRNDNHLINSHPVLLVIFLMCLTIYISTLTYKYIEKPLQAKTRQYLNNFVNAFSKCFFKCGTK